MEKPPRGLKPALAGLIIDHEIDTQERYATFIDLILKGKIKYQKKKGTKYYTLINDTDLLEYEKYILDYVFENKRILKLTEVQYKLNQNCETFKFKIAEEAKRQKIYTLETKKITNIYNIYFRKLFKTIKKQILFGILIFIIFLLCFGLVIFSIINLLTSFYIGTIIIVIVFGILFVKSDSDFLSPGSTQGYATLGVLTEIGVIKGKKTEFESRYLNKYITNEGSKIREKYLNMYNFIKTHPLKKYRMSNEFVAYSVVFGLIKNYESLPE